MSLVGQSHFALIAAMGTLIAIVFVAVVRFTRANRRDIVAALFGAVAAGGVNVATDAAAYAAGFWRYVEVTTPFGPLVYYAEAGLGCAALALVLRALVRAYGWRAGIAMLATLAVYAPVRDWATAHLTHLLVFRYDPLLLVVVADALSSFIVPVIVAYGVVRLGAGAGMPRA